MKRSLELATSPREQDNSSLDRAHRPLHVVSPYLSAAEAVVYLRLKTSAALYWLVREQHLPFCRRGRLYLFDTREIDAWTHGHGSSVEWKRATKRS